MKNTQTKIFEKRFDELERKSDLLGSQLSIMMRDVTRSIDDVKSELNQKCYRTQRKTRSDQFWEFFTSGFVAAFLGASMGVTLVIMAMKAITNLGML